MSRHATPRRWSLALGLLAALLGATIAAPPASARSHPAQSASTQKDTFRAGVTYTHYTFPGNSHPAAVARGENVLASIGGLQVVPLYGWGISNPSPNEGEYDWSSLEARIKTITDSGGTPVLTLCGAPDWMKKKNLASTHYDDPIEVAPDEDRYDEFAQLAAAAAKHFPQVKHFMVWNELKGFWNDSANRWNYEGYTELYNKVYSAIKKPGVRPDAQVGGPYTTVNHTAKPSSTAQVSGEWGTIDQRSLDVITYWLKHKAGAEFLVVDGATHPEDTEAWPTDVKKSAQKFAAVDTWIRSKTQLPIWWAEFYYTGDANVPMAKLAQGLDTTLAAMKNSGASAALLWGPECHWESPTDKNSGVASASYQPCLWSTTTIANGGRETPVAEVMRRYQG
jgi:hypothetical protein